MLDTFKGEFFMHPAALEFSGNTCSNACAYCFASLRAEERTAQVRKLANLCLGKSAGTSHIDWLFNNGYPICVSNRSDPFATSNRDNTGVVLQLLDMVPNGVFFQTKGLSKGVDYSLLDGFKKQNVVVYITIDTMNDEICKRIEPGAPLPSARLELAKYAKSRGWFVEIGINPCVKEWLSDADFEKLIEKTSEIGVDGYFLSFLSLGAKDIKVMNSSRLGRLGDKPVDDSVNDKGDVACYVDRYHRLLDLGKVAHIGITPYKSPLMDLECAKLGKAINPVCSFVNWAWDKNQLVGSTVFTFADFISVMFRGNPEMATYSHSELYKYIMTVNRALWKSNNKVKSIRTFEEVYRTCWNFQTLRNSPQNRFCFAKIVDSSGKAIRDDYGNIKLYFLGRDRDARRNNIRTISIDDLKRKGVNVHE